MATAASQARWRARKKLREATAPVPDDWAAALDAKYPIPFGWTIHCARAWAESGDPQPTTQAEADAWRAAWLETL
jgi:hypothetical protein